MTLATRQRELASILTDPPLFGKAVLGHRYWSMQEQIMRAVAEHPLVAVKACHASSKTFTAADIVLWWLQRYDDAKVVTTAPTWLQVEALLWGEIRSSIQTSKIAYPDPNLTSLRISESRFAIGLSTDQPTRFQGFHGGHVLVIFDEATGVRAPIWEAMEGIRAGGDVHVLAIGNPTEIGTPFHQLYQSNAVGWKKFTISAFDTPNLHGETVGSLRSRIEADPDMEQPWWDDNNWPMLITRRWVGEMLKSWGESHPLWQSRVLGEFPENDPGAVIPLGWIMAAQDRWRERYESKQIPDANRIGLDVGSGQPGSDKTVFAHRRNTDIVRIDKHGSIDTMQAANKLHAYMVNGRVTAIIDWTGIGTGPVDRLRELGVFPERFIAGAATEMKDRTGMFGFPNVRSASWWNMRELLDPNNGSDIALPPDDELTAELAAPVWQERAGAKIYVESKDEIRKRIGRSTDVADAVIMAYWGHPGGGGGAKKQSVWREAGVSHSRHRGKSAWAI